MDQSGTSEVEQPVSGEQDAQADAPQFDLFGMPVEQVPASAAPAAATPATVDETAQLERRRQPRAKKSATTLWQEDDAPPAPIADADADSSSTPSSPDTPKKRRTRDVLAAPPSAELLALAAELPAQIHLGTSTWSFPGWNGIVYGDEYSNSKLSREGLTAYGAHPLLKTVSIDRSFYQALTVTEYLRYAQQVPEHFRFIVKAPMTITDATVRAERGEPVSLNPCFLNAQMAIDEFVTPCLEGLGTKAGALVFQLSPLPDQMLAQPAVFIERLAEFLTALPKLPEGTCYAIEIRDGSLLTPRFIRTLKAAGVRYCVGIHARMPDPLRQAAALALLDGEPAGPLIVRWSLHGGFKYEQAKAKYEPFNQLVDQDPSTRAALAELAARYALAGQPVVIAINNKAEGSAPLSCVELAREIIEAYARLAHEHEHEHDQVQRRPESEPDSNENGQQEGDEEG
ncbi:DUF72 domain-containing protein [Paraburkholderia aspalathi]|uniref:Uncharacterized conserved protein YecE, DUF72 family n=1 Tax=Paraburkholderia aspalathi TaxID=1324617 RepID=A0A1I7DLM3_9BURK|nr:DUF72 domain-containing protein [Paraburkholderia aspalathi]MBK3836520.1 DUF72 domain-containing protein [Paraburkholderia aspalathi]CAE6688618.1 hypothetical protein R69746_00238 [Paraburkholderia aspalathi]SFU12567.1 Uncharacterized conserved protein YecE, DUF72 family [Paraburkholderia aspalathi]